MALPYSVSILGSWVNVTESTASARTLPALIIGSFAVCRTFQESIALIQSGTIRVDPMITHRFPAEQWQDAFAAAAAFVMVAFVGRSLTAQAADQATVRAEQIADGGVRDGRTIVVADPGEQFVQVLRGTTVVASSANVAGLPLLAVPGPKSTVRFRIPTVAGPFIAASAVTVGVDGPRTVVVGLNVDDIDDSRHVVALALLIGVPLLLVVVGVVTWRMVGRTLRPVEDMRELGEHTGQRGVEVGLRDQALPQELLLPGGDSHRVGVRRLRLVHVRSRRGQRGIGLLQLGLEQAGIEGGQQLAFLHRGVEVDEELVDDPRHLRADVDGDDGGDVAGGVDDLAHRPPCHRVGAVERVRRPGLDGSVAHALMTIGPAISSPSWRT